ncbi:MAG: nucleotidyltransferase domain-containing protein [Deltaproteobacteria bacterium]|nr:nucleotidyltransferase domain-containing protein [Deltaproteobacteria bacterium]
MKDIIQKVFKKYKDRILFAYLFGSHAQGTASKSSDIDIAVFLKAYFGESFFDIKIDLLYEFKQSLKTE